MRQPRGTERLASDTHLKGGKLQVQTGVYRGGELLGRNQRVQCHVKPRGLLGGVQSVPSLGRL